MNEFMPSPELMAIKGDRKMNLAFIQTRTEGGIAKDSTQLF
jgi:hypothetical protein